MDVGGDISVHLLGKHVHTWLETAPGRRIRPELSSSLGGSWMSGGAGEEMELVVESWGKMDRG